jgi:GxxExxY protein
VKGESLLLREEVYAVVGAAIEVSNELGAGFLEAVYEEALVLELSERAIPFKRQQRIPIGYKRYLLEKTYIADLVCFDSIIVEIKAVKKLTTNEQTQVFNYLKATGLHVGLLLNFGSPRLEWKRMVLTMSTSNQIK